MTKVTITSGGKERLNLAASTLTPLFIDDPILTYLLFTLSDSKRKSYLQAFMTSLLKAAALNGATFLEANDWDSCAVLVHPGHKVDNPFTLLQAGLISAMCNIGISGIKRVLFEFTSRTDAARLRALKTSKKYYYLYFIGTRTDRRKMGLCSTLVGEVQDIARKGGCPLWLEATTAYSRDIYARLGFEIIEEIVLGQGRVGEDGLRKKNGEGVRVWGMIWRPEDGEEKKMKGSHK